MNNKIDLHAFRAAVAKEHYNRYLELFKTDETAHRRVYDEICARWKRYNGIVEQFCHFSICIIIVWGKV
jgi:hypothetical protein